MRFIPLFFLFSCTSLFYQPSREVFYDPSQFGVKFEELRFNSLDGTRLHGMHMKSKLNDRLGLVTFFHGNAENLSSHFHQLSWLTAKGYEVFIFDYRGYGKSYGEASQEKVKEDGVAAIAAGQKIAEQNSLPHFVFGHSLGGNIAVASVHSSPIRKKIRGLILHGTFVSYQAIAKDKLELSWLTYLLSPLAYLLVSDSNSALGRHEEISMPTLVLHGLNDPVVPFENGKEVFKKIGSKEKSLLLAKNAQHGNLFHIQSGKYRSSLLSFLKKFSPKKN